jgi:adenylate kinase family enzyme
MENEPIEVTLVVTGIFERLGVPYLIGGSLASTLYGMVRTTQDSDIITEMHLEHIEPFVSALEGDFYVDQEMIAESIQRNSSFNIIHRDTMFKVDVFIPYPRPFLQSQLARARRQTFNFGKDVSAKFASPEDTILSKMEWYRMGGEASDRQWRDILGVLKTRTGELDLNYLQQWAKELKVSDLLERALTQATS